MDEERGLAVREAGGPTSSRRPRQEPLLYYAARGGSNGDTAIEYISDMHRPSREVLRRRHPQDHRRSGEEHQSIHANLFYTNWKTGLDCREVDFSFGDRVRQGRDRRVLQDVIG